MERLSEGRDLTDRGGGSVLEVVVAVAVSAVVIAVVGSLIFVGTLAERSRRASAADGRSRSLSQPGRSDPSQGVPEPDRTSSAVPGNTATPHASETDADVDATPPARRDSANDVGALSDGSDIAVTLSDSIDISLDTVGAGTDDGLGSPEPSAVSNEEAAEARKPAPMGLTVVADHGNEGASESDDRDDEFEVVELLRVRKGPRLPDQLVQTAIGTYPSRLQGMLKIEALRAGYRAAHDFRRRWFYVWSRADASVVYVAAGVGHPADLDEAGTQRADSSAYAQI